MTALLQRIEIMQARLDELIELVLLYDLNALENIYILCVYYNFTHTQNISVHSSAHILFVYSYYFGIFDEGIGIGAILRILML